MYKTLSPLKTEWQDWKRFWQSFDEYQNLAPPEKKAKFKDLFPCLKDAKNATANTDIEPTYFYQDSWAFEKIVKQSPLSHIDVGSNHKYVALLSKVVPVTMVDIRPLSLPLNTLSFVEGSILDLPFEDNSIESLSCLCVVEHIGLGRYGDPLDPYGSEKAIRELKRVLKVGGNLYFSVPVEDKNITYFNAHRSFSEDYLESILKPCKIIEKKYIYGKIFQNNKENGKFGIGLYQIQKKEETSYGNN